MAGFHPKIAGLGPDWAPFRGFSLLFDDPASSVFYERLADAVVQLQPDRLKQDYLFCALPPSSYHVTAWDGVNDGNLAATGAHRGDAERLLGDIETASDSPMLDCVRESRLARETWEIAFSCDGLVKRDALVVRLMPDQVSAARFAELLAARDELSNEFLQKFGVAPGRPYVPHVSIGYFANTNGADRAAGYFAAWNALICEALTGAKLRLATIGLYSFNDMARFFRLD